MKRIVILSGAGISAESGIRTFRDSDGLWEGHDVMEVATPEGWIKNTELVLDFYNQRRAQLKAVEPNKAHELIGALQSHYHVDVITQNVDNLHERGGSDNVYHLHGELNKVRSTKDESIVLKWENDLYLGDLCSLGSQLRPHIVWFGEAVPLLEFAAKLVSQADIVIIIGTSLQVYPAAGLIQYARNANIYYIDPHPKTNYELDQSNYTLIPETATIGMEKLYLELFK